MVHHSQYEILLAKHLQCKPSEIARRRSPHVGMSVLEFKGQEYAVGAPGLTENYYGPEIKLNENVSAYRITIATPDMLLVELDFKGFEVQLASQLTGRAKASEPNLANLPQKHEGFGRTGDVANALHSLQTAIVCIENVELEAAIETIQKVQASLATAFHLESELEAADPYAQWTTTCPKCGAKDKLEVKEVTMASTCERHRPCTPLKADGFDVNYRKGELKDQSTEDEEVVCMACGTVFCLNDLRLEKLTPDPTQT